MKPFGIILCWPVFFGLMVTGCVGNASTPVGEDGEDVFSVDGTDYRQRGITLYDRIDDQIVSTTGCEVTFTYYKPREATGDVLVMLGHGFMRNKKRMAYLAKHLASWGISVVNVEFCNSKFWAGNHDRNGADLVAVSKKINADNVIYIGFSAGGLAAMVAANQDNNTQAFFGLDMVDHQGLGKKLAPNLAVPFYGLIAPPSVCNAQNNGLDSYAAAPNSRVVKIEDSSHCHFEFPVEAACLFVCGKGEERFSRANIQQTIVGLTTAYLLWQTGIDPNGETWWASSQPNYQNIMRAGLIAKPGKDGD